jgi:hypothetical protein
MTGILQTIQTTLQSSFQSTTAGWVLVPGMAVTITPSATTNYVLIFMKLTLGSDGSNGVAYKIQRNGTDIDIGNAAGSRTQASGTSLGTQLAVDSGISVCEVFVDTPASVGALTYQVYVNMGASANVNVNQPGSSATTATYFASTSNIVVMEFQP